MTNVTGTVKDVSGVPDNTEWRFSTVLRENAAGTQVVSTKTVTVKPVAGVFTAAIEPGFVLVTYKGVEYATSLPNQASIDIWDLISIQVPLPASAVSAFGNGLANAVDAADALSKLGLTSAVTSTGVVTGSRLVSTVATGTAPLTVASTTNVANLNASQLQGYVGNTSAVGATLALRDTSGYIAARNFIPSFTTQAAAGTTTTLVNGSSSAVQEFTGTANQTVVLPTTGVAAGQFFKVINNSTGTVTVQSSALATVSTITTGTEGTFTALVAAPTTAAHWEDGYYVSPTAVQAISGKTTIGASGAITGSNFVSTVATGTAPLTVASTTVVANLNAATTNGYGPAQTTAANTLATRDANSNLQARGFIPGFTATATAGATTTLIASSSATNQFTGTLAQTCVLPSAGVLAGQEFRIINSSTGAVTVQSSALAAIGAALTTGTTAKFIALIATPTTAANWQRV